MSENDDSAGPTVTQMYIRLCHDGLSSQGGRGGTGIFADLHFWCAAHEPCVQAARLAASDGDNRPRTTNAADLSWSAEVADSGRGQLTKVVLSHGTTFASALLSVLAKEKVERSAAAT